GRSRSHPQRAGPGPPAAGRSRSPPQRAGPGPPAAGRSRSPPQRAGPGPPPAGRSRSPPQRAGPAVPWQKTGGPVSELKPGGVAVALSGPGHSGRSLQTSGRNSLPPPTGAPSGTSGSDGFSLREPPRHYVQNLWASLPPLTDTCGPLSPWGGEESGQPPHVACKQPMQLSSAASSTPPAGGQQWRHTTSQQPLCCGSYHVTFEDTFAAYCHPSPSPHTPSCCTVWQAESPHCDIQRAGFPPLSDQPPHPSPPRVLRQ
ncbi:hypothetical protein KUCAC02_024287, partial [Chaenocephalus aceratus]